MVWFTIVSLSYRNQDFQTMKFFSIVSLLFFLPRRFNAITTMYTLLPSAHNITQSYCRPYFAAISLYRIIIYSTRFTLRRNASLTYTKDVLCTALRAFLFLFYLVCRTSHIPRELIISVFNFLSLVYTELCVLNGELLLALPVCLLCNTEFICHRWTVARKKVLINHTQSKRDTIYQFTCCYAKWKTPFGLFCIKKNASQRRQSHWIKNIKTLKCRKMCMEKIVLLKYQKIQLDRSENKFYWIIKIIM